MTNKALKSNFLDYSTDKREKLSTLVDLLHYRGQYQPDKQAYIFLQNGETESRSLTYGELDRRAKAIAHSSEWLQHNLLKCFYRQSGI